VRYFLLTAAIITALGIGFVAGDMLRYHREQPQLPYSEPHAEGELPDGTPCVAWQVQQFKVIICEGKPVMVVYPKRKKPGYSS
jgi:hypothetical protein